MGEVKHPIQPLVIDPRGTLRFKSNAIVRWLLDNGPHTMNDIARGDFSREDREQFAQLIGYSHSGSADLGYVSDDVWEMALAQHEGRDPQEDMRNKLDELRRDLAEPMARLFGTHPDDLFPTPNAAGEKA
jgi:hypothetical protein